MSDSITIHWPYLLLAVALLWFPRSWLRSGKRLLKKRRKPDDVLEQLAGVGAKDPQNKSVQLGREFKNFRNYVDLLRALAGGYSLTHYSFSVASGEAMPTQVLAWQAAIALGSVAIQSVRYDKRLSFYAPIFFLLGLATGFMGDYTSAFAFALVLAINPIIPNPRWFLTAHGVFMLPLGYVFGSSLAELMLMVGLILMLPLITLLLKCPLVIFTKKARSSSRSQG